jgi:hypothetical protein
VWFRRMFVCKEREKERERASENLPDFDDGD